MKWVIGFLVVISMLLFWSFFRYGQYPAPTNYMIAWYEPWRSYNSAGGALSIAHKAVADDVFRSIYPFKHVASDLMIHGQWPLWNPYNGAGQPLLASMLPGILNPLSFFLLGLFGGLGWSIYIVIQPFILGLATYAYGRSIGISKRGSLIAATVLVFSGFAVARYIFGDYVYGLIALPILLYVFEKYRQKGNLIWLFVLPLIISGLIVTSHPQIILYVLMFTGLYVMVMSKKVFASRVWLYFPAMMFGVMGSAIQLLPTIELVRQANVSVQSSGFIMDRFLLPLSHFVTVLIPNYYGNQGTYNWWGHGDYIETAVSLGIIPTFLALGALHTWIGKRNPEQRKLVGFFLGIIAITIVATLNWAGTRFFYHLPIPILSTGSPARIFILTTFSLSMLSGIGFDRLLQEKRVSRILSVGFILIVGFIAAYTLYLYRVHAPCPSPQVPNCRTIAIRNSLIEFGAFVVLMIALFLRKWKNGALFFSCMLITLVVLGVYNGNKFLPFSPPASWYPSTALTAFLQKITPPWRIMGLEGAQLSTDLASEFRVFDPNNYNPLYIKRYGELVAYVNTGIVGLGLSRSDVQVESGSSPSAELTQRRSRFMDLASVKYLLTRSTMPTLGDEVWSDSQWHVLNRKSALPRVYFVDEALSRNRDDAVLSTLFSPSFNPATQAVVEEHIQSGNDNPKEGTAEVGPQLWGDQNLSVSVSTDKPRLLVITQNYDAGWHARIDGKPVRLYRTNYSFQGVMVSPGEHVVSLVYMPTSFVIGRTITFGTIGVWIAAFLVWVYKKKNLLKEMPWDSIPVE